MSNTHTTSVKKCQARAYAYVVELIGDRPETLTWDATHCLQGHVHVGCHELVVIATRDASHEPVVMTTPSWDAVRRSSSEHRRELIDTCAITNHSSLVSVFESDDVAVYGPVVALAA